jgi:hypothetical protein
LVSHFQVRGRLKICSKSIVFVPQASANQQDLGPLYKFPLADCTKIEGEQSGVDAIIAIS